MNIACKVRATVALLSLGGAMHRPAQDVMPVHSLTYKHKNAHAVETPIWVSHDQTTPLSYLCLHLWIAQ